MPTVLTIDETSGVQNVQTGVTSNDTSAPLPLRFQDALAAEGLVIGTVNAVALSGVDGDPANANGANILTFGAGVTDIGFTNSSGGALVGVDSGLKTTDGKEIFLYTSTFDNNVVVGRVGTLSGSTYVASPTGTIAFAAFLDPGAATDTNATGAKLWLSQYQPMFQPDATNPNDIVFLSGKLNVSVNNLANFSLEGAPSGQNLFLMFGDGSPDPADVTIVVTGKHPADNGAGLSTGDTVNTGQGGGMTTIGSNNQMIDPAEGMYFTFVKGANTGLTVPNLDQNEADLESNIDFGTFFGLRSASFQLVQMQPPKAATLLVSAFNNTDATEKGTAYIEGLGDADDAAVNIDAVTITRLVKVGKSLVPTDFVFTESSNTPQAGLTLDFSGNTVKITGAVAGDRVAYHTVTDHNRVLVDNLGNTDAKFNSAFDIGSFKGASGALTTTALNDLAFVDDGPTASIVRTTDSLTLDETLGTKTGDTNAATDDITATNTDPFGGTYGTPIGALSGVDLVNTTGGAGTDSVGATTTVTLSIVNGSGSDSGLKTTDGTQIDLWLETNGQVTGRTGGASGTVVLAISIDNDGKVAMAQYAALQHPTPGSSHDEAVNLSGKLNAVVTVKDGDLDPATSSIGIGDALLVQDDGPSIAANTSTLPTLTTDDTDIPDTAGPTSFVGVFTTPAFGSDGFKDSNNDDVQDADAVAYTLGVSATGGVDSGLVDSVSGKKIFLFLQSGTVNGRVGSASNTADAAGTVAFAISVDGATGAITLTQNNSVMHNDPADPVESGTSAATMAATLVALNVTITDGDGDTATASRNIGDAFRFEDDGPSVAFGNLIGTGTVEPQSGFWTMAAGTDTLGASGLDISLTGFTLVRPDNTTTTGTTTFSELSGSPDGSGSYLFGGSLTGDFDNNPATTPQKVDFTLTAFANGKYTLDLVQGFASTVTTSTANGALGAGGPDPVQTLTIPKPPATPQETAVFFSVKPLASNADILTGVGSGLSDPTETQLQTNPLPSYIDPRAMNVSTSGIGVANNLLEGDTDQAIGATDESFVVNPAHLLSSVTVKIDNSVGGYSFTSGERLYYKVVYDDGSFSGNALVDQDLGLANKGQPTSFVISGGAKLIDAVQLTMASGDIKIPEILFTTSTENLAMDVKLDFLATVTDKDGDTATDAFAANLFSSEAAGGSFDFILAGTASVQDAFNVDLSGTKNKYQVTGFDAGDKLVLVGDATATVQSINNGGADSIVTIAETGGAQSTTVTVVGVDLANTDIVFG